MSGSPHPVVGEYDRLASYYDRRWTEYIQATTETTARRIALVPGARLLDVGCGTGALLQRLCQQHPQASLTGIDPSSEMLRQARRKLPSTIGLAQGFAERLPFQDGAFDLVASNSAFHYFDDPERALREMQRVLRPGGQVVITDWCDDYLACRVCERWLRWTDPAHRQIYGSRKCRALLEHSGLVGVTLTRYRINWLWGLMTARAEKPVAAAPLARVPIPN